MPTIMVDQNLLMQKLGLATGTHFESDDFARYIDLFLDGLSEEQLKLIHDLFKDHGAEVRGVVVGVPNLSILVDWSTLCFQW
jgi:hypothetical protein